MKRIIFNILLVALSSSLRAQQPNIILVMFDDLNDYTTELQGSPQVETPNLSALAELGTSFQNAYCVAPQCGPSRASLITGKDCDYTRVYNNLDYKCMNFRKMFLPVNGNEFVYTLPEWLKDTAGYYTYSLNKILHCHDKLNDFDTAAVDACDKQQSWNRVLYVDDSLLIETYGDAHLGGPDHFRWTLLPDSMEQYCEDYIMVDSAIAFISQYDADPSIACNKPFFLGVGFDRPHLPYFVPEHYYNSFYLHDYYAEPYVKPYNFPVNAYPYNGIVLPPQPEVPFSDYDALNPEGVAEGLVDPATYNNLIKHAEDIIPMPEIDPALTEDERMEILEQSVYANAIMGYLATIKFVDAQLGRFMAALAAHPDIYNNTIIVITSDHGFSLGEKKHMLKGAMWETDTRVPFIIVDLRNPVKVQSMQTASLLDVFPTVCSMINIGVPEFPDGSQYLDGINLASIVSGNNVQYERPALTTYVEKNVEDQGGCFPQYSVRDERFHFIQYRTNNVYGELDCDYANSIIERELYDIGVYRETDPNEWNNLIEHPDYQPVVNYLGQFLPDSNLYMQKTWKPLINFSGVSCVAAESDTIQFSYTLLDTAAVETPLPAGYTLYWHFNLIPHEFSDASFSLPVSEIPFAILDTGAVLMVYLDVYDAEGKLVGFDTRDIIVGSDDGPSVYFELTYAGPFMASVTDFTIDGEYNSFWWDLGDGPTFYNVVPSSIDFEVPGTYPVTLYVQYGNDSSCVTDHTVSYTTGVYEYFRDSIIIGFPNPTRDFIHVVARYGLLPGEMQVFDMAGRKVLESTITSNDVDGIVFDVQHLATGMYVIHYMYAHGSTTLKFIRADDTKSDPGLH